MIIFKDLFKEITKLFSSIKDKSSYIKREDVFLRFPLELMKLLEMNTYNNGALINHWANKPLKTLYLSQNYYTLSEALSMFCVKDFNELRNVIGSNEINLLKKQYNTPDELINYVRYRMLNDKSPSGEPKYVKMWFASHEPKVTNEDFRLIMKFIILCFTGQLDKESFSSFWDKSFIKSLHTTKVKYNSSRKLSIPEILATIICAISGYSGINYTDRLT